MANMFKKTFAMLMALCMLVVSMPIQALADENENIDVPVEASVEMSTETPTVILTIVPPADEEGNSVVEVETTAGNEETVEVKVETEETVNEDGSTTVTTKAETNNFVTEDGMIVDFEGKSEITTDEDGNVSGKSETHYTTQNESGSYTAEGGTEAETEVSDFDESHLANSTLDIPLTDVDDPSTEEVENVNTVEGIPAGTIIETEGDPKESPDDGVYDYTETVVVQPGKVEVTTTDITITEDVDAEGTDLDYVKATDTADANNDMFIDSWESDFNHDMIDETVTDPNSENITKVDGYNYTFLGQANNSQFYAAFLYNTPGSPDEKPAYVDENGKAYYTHKGAGGPLTGNFILDGYYQNGEKVTDEEVGFVWGNVTQYMLVDSETGELITTYCADNTTQTQDGYGYNIKNIEDATYYSEAEAAMIRAVAKNGYWGVADDASTEEAEYGSLESVKEMMKNAVDENGERVFSDEEIDLLTEGAAMTATQYAIWTFSNKMDGVEFLNTHWIKKDADNVGPSPYVSWANIKDVPEDKKDTRDVIFKLFNHLINLDPDVIEEHTTANTIINAENFVEDLSVTIVEKDTEHANNKDKDNTNDAFVTNLTFSLVVAPSTENGDDLVVRVLDANNKPLAEGRLAGELKDGETLLVPDAEGNYTFAGITMIEGEQNFNLTLSGIQHLKEGVYIYSSEIRDDVAAQTMVGVAGGKRAVSVSMNISFELNVEEQVVAKERVWRVEQDPQDPPVRFRNPPPTIPDEPVPLADVPQTGDISVLWFAMILFSGCGLCALKLFEKKFEA